MRVSVEKARNIGILFSISSMLIGFVAGLFRLLKENSAFNLPELAPLYNLHSLLMVFGFLGGLLMTERIVGSKGMARAYGPSFSVPMLLFAIAGLLLLAAGWLLGSQLESAAGGSLFAAASLMFTAMLLRLGRIANDYSSFGIMSLGTVSLTVSSAISGFRLPVDDYPLIILMLLFPVIFVLGERIELTKFHYFPRKRFVVRCVFMLLAASVMLAFAAAVAWSPNSFYATLSLTISLACLAGAIALTFAAERKRKAPADRTILQTYVDKCISIAYFWLFLGVFLFILRVNGVVGLYDAAIHSIALGFVVTFIFAHGPVIFPTVIGRKANISNLSYLPLLTLTLSNCMRISGDVFKLHIDFTPMVIQVASAIVSLSGIILGIGALQFAAMMRSIMASRDAKQPKGADPV